MKIPKWIRSIGLLDVLVLMLIVIILGVPFFLAEKNAPGEKGYRHICASNLGQIGLALKQYSMDNSDIFPDKDGVAGLELIRKNEYLTDSKVYTCCVDKKTRMAKPQSCLAEKNVSYIYFGGFSEKGNRNIPLALDRLGSHKDYINVLFVNGNVIGFPGKFCSYSDVITMLNEKYKYSPEELKILKEKAAELDKLCGF